MEGAKSKQADIQQAMMQQMLKSMMGGAAGGAGGMPGMPPGGMPSGFPGMPPPPGFGGAAPPRPAAGAAPGAAARAAPVDTTATPVTKARARADGHRSCACTRGTLALTYRCDADARSHRARVWHGCRRRSRPSPRRLPLRRPRLRLRRPRLRRPRPPPPTSGAHTHTRQCTRLTTHLSHALTCVSPAPVVPILAATLR
jgi:hypothetical protein